MCRWGAHEGADSRGPSGQTPWPCPHSLSPRLLVRPTMPQALWPRTPGLSLTPTALAPRPWPRSPRPDCPGSPGLGPPEFTRNVCASTRPVPYLRLVLPRNSRHFCVRGPRWPRNSFDSPVQESLRPICVQIAAPASRMQGQEGMISEAHW